MELEILKKKLSTYRTDGGYLKNVSDEVLMEILREWELWTGPASGFYTGIGVSAKGIASIIGKGKKLKREGHFPVEEFKEIKVEGSQSAAYIGGPCVGIELSWEQGKVIRFPDVSQLIDFLKKVA